MAHYTATVTPYLIGIIKNAYGQATLHNIPTLTFEADSDAEAIEKATDFAEHRMSPPGKVFVRIIKEVATIEVGIAPVEEVIKAAKTEGVY